MTAAAARRIIVDPALTMVRIGRLSSLQLAHRALVTHSMEVIAMAEDLPYGSASSSGGAGSAAIHAAVARGVSQKMGPIAAAEVRTGTVGGVDLRALVAEFVGTLTLIFAGVCAIAVTTGIGPAQSLVAVAFAHGLAISVMVSATMAISGGHLNPAVTLGALVGGKISRVQAIGHWVAQVLGAIVGALLTRAVLPAGMLARAGYGVPAPGSGVGVGAAVVTELVLTFFLVFVVFGTAIDLRAPKVGGLFIGLAVVMGILAGGPISGAALNPARFLGPALVNASQLQYTWIYLVGPLAGGLLAGVVWRFVILAPRPAEA
jgi:aquaporin TIP